MFDIVIVDDYPMVRQGFALLVSLYDDMRVVGMGSNGYEAITLCQTYQPDMLVIDYQMPLMDGITAIRYIRQQFPSLPIILLSSLGDNIHPKAVTTSGVNLHLLKESNGYDILATIRKFFCLPV
jgi:DNA-binding NarL/FixJ family response regulator